MTTARILESAGITAGTLESTVNAYRSLGSPPGPDGTAGVEDLCAALEVLAARMGMVADTVDRLSGLGGAVADVARAVADTILPPEGRAEALVAAAVGIRAPILTRRLVFGHPDLTAVVHAVVDEQRRTFVMSSYLVHLPTESVFAVLSGESLQAAAVRVRAGLDQLSRNSLHRSK